MYLSYLIENLCIYLYYFIFLVAGMKKIDVAVRFSSNHFEKFSRNMKRS